MFAAQQENQSVAWFEATLTGALQRLGAARGSVLAAVSGGVDSMVLLRALGRVRRALGLRVEAACIDHGLRPAVEDLAVVQRLAAELGVPVHTSALALSPGPGVEARARMARYGALEALRHGRGLDVIATAHTASDQAETLLMRLARGCALAGAAGVLERRADAIVRPLLFATRDEVREYAAATATAWVSDPMNDDRTFLRVRVRHDLMPVFTEVAGAATVRTLARFSRLAAEDDGYLDDQAGDAWVRVRNEGGTLDEVAVTALARPIARRVLGRLLGHHGLPMDSDAIDRALSAVQRSGTATLPGDQVLTCRDGQVHVESAARRVSRVPTGQHV